jgi:hypothetical protein
MTSGAGVAGPSLDAGVAVCTFTGMCEMSDLAAGPWSVCLKPRCFSAAGRYS